MFNFSKCKSNWGPEFIYKGKLLLVGAGCAVDLIAMALQPFKSRSWTDSSLVGALDSVDDHHRFLVSSGMSEEDMKKELAVPLPILKLCFGHMWLFPYIKIPLFPYHI